MSELRDGKTARQRIHREAFELKSLDRFAHGRATDSQSLGNLGFPQAVARPQAAGVDVGSQLDIDEIAA
jgi:hypothetical protein